MARGFPKARQLGVKLTDDLREQLEVARTKAGHSVGEEIRQRLERTFREDAVDPLPPGKRRDLVADPQTRELLAAIIRIAEWVRLDLRGNWHSDKDAHEAFAAAIAARILHYKPDTQAKQGAVKQGAVLDLFGGALNDPPETIGRTIERADRRQHPDEHLEAATLRWAATMAQTLKPTPKKEGDEQ